MPNLRGTDEAEKQEIVDIRKAEPDDEFDFELTDEVGMLDSAEEAKNVWTSGRRSAKQILARCKGSGHKTESKMELRGGGAEKGKRSCQVEKNGAD